MRVYKNRIKPDQLGDVTTCKCLLPLVEIMNTSNLTGSHASLRTARLIHQFNRWIKMIETKKIIPDKGMFSREVTWYLDRCVGALGETFLRNYIRTRVRKLPKGMLISLGNIKIKHRK